MAWQLLAFDPALAPVLDLALGLAWEPQNPLEAGLVAGLYLEDTQRSEVEYIGHWLVAYAFFPTPLHLVPIVSRCANYAYRSEITTSSGSAAFWAFFLRRSAS